MRTLLVINHFATTTDDAICATVCASLSGTLDLTVVNTGARNEAIQIAKAARDQGYELVIGLGGDGTLNEIANGLLADGPNPQGPILGAIPGGNANVFARNMGFENDAAKATNQLLAAVRNESFKTIGVGKISTENLSRWFLFNSGFGLDAAVLASMEARRESGKNASDATYVMLALRELFARTDRKKPELSLVGESGEIYSDAHFALIINLAPWAYLGKRAVNPMPEAGHESALDAYAPTTMSIPALWSLVRGAMKGISALDDERVITLADQKQIQISANRPLWIQVDGDVISKARELTAVHIPNALRVIV
jgi:diacylglycerol kinase family enzyme